MDIFDKARELGTMIARSDDMAALKAAEEALENDQEALRLLRKFQKAQKELMNAIRLGSESARVDLLKQKYDFLREEIEKCDVTRNFLKASANFENLLKQINDIITFMVRGPEEDSSSGSCNGCAGCGGCSR